MNSSIGSFARLSQSLTRVGSTFPRPSTSWLWSTTKQVSESLNLAHSECSEYELDEDDCSVHSAQFQQDSKTVITTQPTFLLNGAGHQNLANGHSLANSAAASLNHGLQMRKQPRANSTLVAKPRSNTVAAPAQSKKYTRPSSYFSNGVHNGNGAPSEELASDENGGEDSLVGVDGHRPSLTLFGVPGLLGRSLWLLAVVLFDGTVKPLCEMLLKKFAKAADQEVLPGCERTTECRENGRKGRDADEETQFAPEEDSDREEKLTDLASNGSSGRRKPKRARGRTPGNLYEKPVSQEGSPRRDSAKSAAANPAHTLMQFSCIGPSSQHAADRPEKMPFLGTGDVCESNGTTRKDSLAEELKKVLAHKEEADKTAERLQRDKEM